MGNYVDLIVSEIPKILNQFSPVFEDMALTLFRYFATIILVWFGIQVMFRGVSAAKFVSLLAIIAITGTLLTYYTAPFPGVGRGFRGIVTDQAAEMTQMISAAHFEELQLQFDRIGAKLEPPGMFDVGGILQYVLVLGCVVIARALSLFAIAYGFIAAAVAGLLGPFFIPFLIFPGMDWMFWGWLKAFIQYAFYPVVANAYTMIMGQILIAFCKHRVTDQASLSELFIPLVVLLVVYIYGIIKLPSLVSSIFSGRSGEGAGPGL